MRRLKQLVAAPDAFYHSQPARQGALMPATIFDSSIFRDIFTTPAMREVWSDENRVQ